MIFRLLADALVVFHFAFIAFVVAGGFLALRHRAWAALHLPAVAWGAWAELTGTICPLTPWENALRARACLAGYTGGFVERYLIPLIYPDTLTAGTQVWLGLLVIAINVAVYAIVWRGRRRTVVTRRTPT
jgi:hypothetical protein